MYCNKCGKLNNDDAKFCVGCGAQMSASSCQSGSVSSDSAVYSIPFSESRKYSVNVYPDRVDIDGDFLYLRDKDFYKAVQAHESCRISDFLGIGYLKMRSWKKTLTFVVAASVLEVFKALVDRLSDLADKANKFLSLIGRSVELPDWMETTINVAAVICFILAIVLFFSLKKVIEISFVDKRICVPQKSMTYDEYQRLYSVINDLTKK